MPATRHTMPAADAAWLHMDIPTNPMVVNGLMRLGAVPSPDAVRATIEARMLAPYPRFRQRVVDPLGRTPAFEDDLGFDLDNHLHRRALPAPGGQAALEELLGDLITPPLDPGRPLWHAYVIEVGDGTAAMLWRIHHSIADGIALAQVMLSMADELPAPPIEPDPEQHPHGFLGRLAAAPGRTVSAARTVAGAAAHEAAATLSHPRHLTELGAVVLHDASTAAKLLASPSDPPTALSRPLSGRRRVAWSRPFPLQDLKDSCHSQRVKLNDLLLMALAATLAEGLDWTERPDHLHAMVPVNLRPLDEPVPRELGNSFALVLLELPLADLPPAERLRQVRSAMDKIKDSIEAPLSYGFLEAMGSMPRRFEERLIGFFTDKASLVVTNVPGPREPLTFAGAPIEGVLVWAPCSGSIGLTVSIFSYAGEVTTGFMADTALVPDPGVLARCFEQELGRLCGSPTQTGTAR
jgi:diacylglycerol O-acyltransferase / wax synthase